MTPSRAREGTLRGGHRRQSAARRTRSTARPSSSASSGCAAAGRPGSPSFRPASEARGTGRRYEDVPRPPGREGVGAAVRNPEPSARTPRSSRCSRRPTACSSPAATSSAFDHARRHELREAALRTMNAAGVHVAGTSAGAAFLSEHMIAFGDEGSTPRAGMVSLAPGLGLTNRVIVDQHFRQRDRLGRLMSAVSLNPFAVGIGPRRGHRGVHRSRRRPGGRGEQRHHRWSTLRTSSSRRWGRWRRGEPVTMIGAKRAHPGPWRRASTSRPARRRRCARRPASSAGRTPDDRSGNAPRRGAGNRSDRHGWHRLGDAMKRARHLQSISDRALYARFPVIRFTVDLGELEQWPTGRLGPAASSTRCWRPLPGLREHGCSYDGAGRLRRAA